jgi:hypothetical protein
MFDIGSHQKHIRPFNKKKFPIRGKDSVSRLLVPMYRCIFAIAKSPAIAAYSKASFILPPKASTGLYSPHVKKSRIVLSVAIPFYPEIAERAELCEQQQ